MPIFQSSNDEKVENTLTNASGDNRYINTHGGDKMEGNLSMNSNKICDLGVCSSSTDAVNKNYVDVTFFDRIKFLVNAEFYSVTRRIDQRIEDRKVIVESQLAINSDRISNLEKRLESFIETKLLEIDIKNIIAFNKYQLLEFPASKDIFVIRLLIRDNGFSDIAPPSYVDHTSKSDSWYLSTTSTVLNINYMETRLVVKTVNIMLYYFIKLRTLNTQGLTTQGLTTQGLTTQGLTSHVPVIPISQK